MPKPELKLDPGLTLIAMQDYPRFSVGEIERRRGLMARAMASAGVEHLVCCAAFFRGGPVHWLSDWLTTYEAVLVFSPGKPDTLFVQFFNHLPQAREIMAGTDVRWGGPSTIDSVLAELVARGAAADRVGAVGVVPMHYHKALAAKFGEIADLNRAYFGLRLVKSEEELDWYRISARLSDLSVEALSRDLRPGIDEGDIAAIIEGAYAPWRASTVIHFVGTTSMHDPQVCVPRQHPGLRKLRTGDAVFCELTASFWEHWGQVLRTFTIEEPPTPLYKDLHDTADAAFNAMVGAARSGAHVSELDVGKNIIAEAGFTFYDDLIHGFGGGYLPPIIGSPIRGTEPSPDMLLEEGMTMVIQPNVITPDQKAGVQTGELMVVTDRGAVSLHAARRGLIVVA